MSKPYPLCFVDQKQWNNWRELARATKVGASEFCTDCTPQYQEKMIAQGRCEHPETTFGKDEDGFMEGIRPNAKAERKKNREKAMFG